MSYKIIADSCCDMTPELAAEYNVVSVPLIMRLGEKEFSDDDSLNLDDFMAKMQTSNEPARSSAPAPGVYQQAIQSADTSYIVTLSSKLSGSYSSAMLGCELAREQGVTATHVFDSKSASAGEILIVAKIHQMVKQGLSRECIITKVTHFIDHMKTYFVLDSYDNLQKNGRMSKLTGRLINVLGIKLVLGSDGEGNISMFSKARGSTQIINRLVALIAASGKKTEGEDMVITHCNNINLVNMLVNAVKQFNFREIIIVPTRGLSSMYAENKGIILAF